LAVVVVRSIARHLANSPTDSGLGRFNGGPHAGERPPDRVSDKVRSEAARNYDERALTALVIAVANINVWNRLNVAVRQPAVN
jgi:hypothetical protein